MPRNSPDAWEFCDGVGYCDMCYDFCPVRAASLPPKDPRVAELYPDGKPGYYCEKCTNAANIS